MHERQLPRCFLLDEECRSADGTCIFASGPLTSPLGTSTLGLEISVCSFPFEVLKSGASTFGLVPISAKAPRAGAPNSATSSPASGVLTDASISGLFMLRFDPGMLMPSFVLPRDGSEIFGLL